MDEVPVPYGYSKELESTDHVFTITNRKNPETPPTPIVPETMSVTANKVWEDANNAGRPESVKFQLMRDGAAYGDPVSVTEQDGWRHVWNDLEKDPVWTVAEIDVPSQYTSSAQQDGNVWTFTNTRKAQNYDDHNGSGSSDSDSDYEQDRKPTVNTNNSQNTTESSTEGQKNTEDSSFDPGILPPDEDDESQENREWSADEPVRRIDSDVPKTGDETHRDFWLLMMGISAAGIFFMNRKREQE